MNFMKENISDRPPSLARVNIRPCYNFDMIDNQFKYSIPKIDKDLSDISKIIIELGAISEQLTKEERFLVDHISGRAENDAEHSHMLSRIAPIIAMRFYPQLDAGLTSMFATIHDDIEAYVGDTPNHLNSDGVIADKKLRESLGQKQLLKEYSHIPEYAKLAKDYEAQVIPEARFVRVLDKLMTVIMPFYDNGICTNKYWNVDEFKHYSNAKTERYKAEYPEFEKLFDVRDELNSKIIDKFYSK